MDLSSVTLEGTCQASPTSAARQKRLVREPYTCERLCQVRGGFTQLTEAVASMEFDFSNPEVYMYDEECDTIDHLHTGIYMENKTLIVLTLTNST